MFAIRFAPLTVVRVGDKTANVKISIRVKPKMKHSEDGHRMVLSKHLATRQEVELATLLCEVCK